MYPLSLLALHQCPFSGSNSPSRWIYEPSLDPEPSRISFAFRLLLCVNLYPNWSAYDLLSRVACVTHPQTLSFTALNVSETCRQQDRLPSRNDLSGTWSARSTSVPPIRVPISLLIETSVSPMKAGRESSDLLEPFSSGSEQTIISDPLHLPGSLYLHPEASRDAIGSKPLAFDFGTNQVPKHLSGPYEVPPRSFISPGLLNSHSGRADSAVDAQQYKGASDFPVLLGQLPSFSSASCCDPSRAKIPLFLPSQTPNRDLSPRGTLSSQALSLQKERTSPPSARPHLSRAVSHDDYPHVGPLCTSALQNVDANNLEAISLRDGRPFHATRFTTPTPAYSPWPIELASNDRPRTPGQLNHGSPPYQRSGTLGKRNRLSSGCQTNDTKSSYALHARGDSGPGETPVRVQKQRGVELASRS